MSQSGTGVIIEGQLILTNAHVVADQVNVVVKRQGTTTEYPAQVVHVGHECDLALLRVSNPKFFEGVKPLEIGELPALESPVDVHGFPVGGESSSVTSGIVSRIEVSTYAHSFEDLLLVQIDAAMNSGNSGGPVIADGAIVGIATQTLDDAENIGYMIPAPVVNQFLVDVEDGRFDGFPRLGAEILTLESEAHRRSLVMKDADSGVLVTSVDAGSSTDGVLEAGDVLLAIDGVEIANDGTIPLREGGRVDFAHAYRSLQVGGTVEVSFLREGKKLKAEASLTRSDWLVPGFTYDQQPAYLVFAGLVFQPLNFDYMSALESAASDLINHAYYQNVVTAGRKQIIVLTKVLASPVNYGYHDWEAYIVESVNGAVPGDMRELAALIDGATGPWLEIETEERSILVIDLEQARRDHESILADHGVRTDRSPDLAATGGALTD